MESFWELLQEKKMLCLCIFFGLFGLFFFGLYFYEVMAEEKYTCPKLEEEEQPILNVEEEIAVDIKGAIANPGVYRVKKGTIVADVITLAGGLLANADTSNLNLSKIVSNEMVIFVFTHEEVTKEQEEKKPIQETGTKTENTNSNLVNLNTATLEELMTLPGIGEQKANLILEYRNQCGDFHKKEELKNIKGIGEAIYAKLESNITV